MVMPLTQSQQQSIRDFFNRGIFGGAQSQRAVVPQPAMPGGNGELLDAPPPGSFQVYQQVMPSPGMTYKYRQDGSRVEVPAGPGDRNPRNPSSPRERDMLGGQGILDSDQGMTNFMNRQRLLGARPSQGRLEPPRPNEPQITMGGGPADFYSPENQRRYNRGINPGGGFGSPFGGNMRGGRQQPPAYGGGFGGATNAGPESVPGSRYYIPGYGSGYGGGFGGGFGGGMMPPPYGGGFGGGFGRPPFQMPNMGYGNRFAGMQFSGPFAQPMMPQNYGMGSFGGFGGRFPMPQPRYPMPQPPMMGGGFGGGYGGIASGYI